MRSYFRIDYEYASSAALAVEERSDAFVSNSSEVVAESAEMAIAILRDQVMSHVDDEVNILKVRQLRRDQVSDDALFYYEDFRGTD